MTKRIIITVSVVALLICVFVFRVRLKDFTKQILKPALPAPQSAQEFTGSSTAQFTAPPLANSGEQTASPSSDVNNGPQAGEVLPQAINLAVPFATQAPFANWDMPYQEACEEAAAIMVHRYFMSEDLNPTIMDKELLALIEWENQTFGYYKDTTAEETARILREYFGHENVEVKYDFEMTDVKRALTDGYPVIMLAAGKLLGNPNFRNGGPVYHALVLKGYTNEKIITNDPGTRNGKDYLYTPEVLMNAAHEWNAENILKGRRAIIVVEE